jgi:hypothetical protein
MKFNYQFGFVLPFRIFWINVSAERFAKKAADFLLQPGQRATIAPAEILGFFVSPDFILRDGWRLFRAVPIEPEINRAIPFISEDEK